LEVLAEESLEDGCLLEDFNADVAAACAEVCRDPATRAYWSAEHSSPDVDVARYRAAREKG